MAYKNEKGCNVNDFFTKMKRQVQTQSFASHVSDSGKTYRTLGTWCKNQRIAKRNLEIPLLDTKANVSRHRISSEQIARLEEIGFSWDPKKYWWFAKLDMLQAYKREDYCSVTDGLMKMKRQAQTQSFGSHTAQIGESYAKLGRWCSTQKTAKRNMDEIATGLILKNGFRISPDQILNLSNVGFKW